MERGLLSGKKPPPWPAGAPAKEKQNEKESEEVLIRFTIGGSQLGSWRSVILDENKILVCYQSIELDSEGAVPAWQASGV